jgi:NAD(P)-dependent dehydrogenase (short-subunit alcohol dehydrogenase family)
MRVNDKVIIVTGAGAGIGRDSALLLAKEGAKLVLTDINEKSIQETVDMIHAQGGQAIFIKHDVSNEDDWINVIDHTLNTYQSIDGLFNSAGIFLIKSLIETSLEEWNNLLSINLTGMFLGMKHVIPVMIKNNGGSIINASSTAGLIGASGLCAYGASKGAIRLLTKDVALEYAQYNIRVNSIHPGYIKTQMVEYASSITKKDAEEVGATVPLGRLGTPTEVAHMVLYLSSDESSYVTGAEFVIDGGLTTGEPSWND